MKRFILALFMISCLFLTCCVFDSDSPRTWDKIVGQPDRQQEVAVVNFLHSDFEKQQAKFALLLGVEDSYIPASIENWGENIPPDSLISFAESNKKELRDFIISKGVPSNSMIYKKWGDKSSQIVNLLKEVDGQVGR